LGRNAFPNTGFTSYTPWKSRGKLRLRRRQREKREAARGKGADYFLSEEFTRARDMVSLVESIFVKWEGKLAA
jgi:hypothetical protein